MKNPIVIFIVVVLGVVGVYTLYQLMSDKTVATNPPGTPGTEVVDTTTPPEEEPEQEPEPAEDVLPKETVIGSSVEERNITAYHYGTGDTELLFVGGIHGGYEWNTVLVAYELMDYLEETPSAIPENVRVTVIPVLNPDGLAKVVGTDGRFTRADVPGSQASTIPGRFNANEVDLNRNFDCDWKASGVWQSRTVSGGSKAFSEPESQAIRDYVAANEPDGVVVWYSAAGGVFASSCHNGIAPDTLTLTNLYADASGYQAYEDFDFYTITGDMVNWFAKNGVPAISVLLTTHTDIEWDKNKKGIDAVLQHYAN